MICKQFSIRIPLIQVHLMAFCSYFSFDIIAEMVTCAQRKHVMPDVKQFRILKLFLMAKWNKIMDHDRQLDRHRLRTDNKRKAGSVRFEKPRKIILESQIGQDSFLIPNDMVSVRQASHLYDW